MSIEGQRLGEFEIIERIGQGGMGAVYRAVQTSLQRTVAIKTLQPALAADAEYIARFHREAIAAAALSHQNLVQVYAPWKKGDGLSAAERAAKAQSSPALQRVEPSATGGRPDGLKPQTTLPAATKDKPFINTLGQEFVPVPGTAVLFCRWETRVSPRASTGSGFPFSLLFFYSLFLAAKRRNFFAQTEAARYHLTVIPEATARRRIMPAGAGEKTRRAVVAGSSLGERSSHPGHGGSLFA